MVTLVIRGLKQILLSDLSPNLLHLSLHTRIQLKIVHSGSPLGIQTRIGTVQTLHKQALDLLDTALKSAALFHHLKQKERGTHEGCIETSQRSRPEDNTS